MTEYQASLARIEGKIASLQLGRESTGSELLSPSECETRLLCLEFQHASLGGDLDACWKLNQRMASAEASASRPQDLRLLRATIAVKLHKIALAEDLLRDPFDLQNCRQGQLVLADVDLQKGGYETAYARIEATLGSVQAWDALARKAHLMFLQDDLPAADDFYVRAMDEISVKEMHVYAWLKLQRGAMYVDRGLYARAEQQYAEADASYSGYWLAEQCRAELAVASGRFDEADATYSRLYRSTPRPAWAHALGDLHALAGDLQKAHAWRVMAYQGYFQGVAEGMEHYKSPLADLCCELAGHQAEAVIWAQADAAARPNHRTCGDLAWALYRNGKADDALQAMEQALGYKIVSPRLFLQAACIFAALGEANASRVWMQKARALNPDPARARIRMGAKKSGLAITAA